MISRKRSVALLIISVILLQLCLTGCNSMNSEDEVGKVVITEAMSSNSEVLLIEDIGSPDWIELHNPSTKDVDLSDYKLYRSDKKEEAYTFKNRILKAGEYLLVLCTEISFDDTRYDCTDFRLPKTGTTVVLKNSNGLTVDQMSIPALNADISYCVFEGKNKFCLTPTPGYENGGLMFNSLSDTEKSIKDVNIMVNEASKEFVELCNYSSKPVQLAYYTLSDNAKRPTRWRFPFKELQPGEYYVAWFGSDGISGPEFSVSTYESRIYFSCGTELIQEIDVARLKKNMSVGLNESKEFVYFADITPGKKNGSVYSNSTTLTDISLGEVYINEVMAENKTCLIDDKGDMPSWLEIKNSSPAEIDLSDYFLSDDEAEPLKWRIPSEKLASGDIKVIYLSGYGEGFHTDFKFGKGENLYLTDYKTLQRQTVKFPDEARLDNISIGLLDGNWMYFSEATPGKENTTHGFSDISNVDKLEKTTPFISEVSTTAAAKSGSLDWIELYNPSSEAYSLEDLYISDSKNNLKKARLSGSIPAKGYKVIDASGNSSKQKNGVAAFGISPAGETLYLTDGYKIIDAFDTGALKVGYTSGRIEDDPGAGRVFYATATKGSKNSTPIGPQINAPIFSRDGGIVNESFRLVISGEGSIYYTTNGSKPTKDSTLYTEPIEISATTVVSAICIKDGHIPSEDTVRTYLFEEGHTLPVVCLSAAPSDFSAVYSVNKRTNNKNDNIERRCYIEYYDTDGKLGVTFPCGFRVSGNSTRSYSQKSLSLHIRGGYGQSSVTYPFFDGYAITEFENLVLRNGGQDWKRARIIDSYANMLFKDLNLDVAVSRPVVVYINGKYYGLYDLKESQNENCLASQHGLDPETLNVVRRNVALLAGSVNEIKNAYNYANSNNMANEANYKKFCTMVDEDSWIDYIIARAFTGDYDMFNQKMWDARDYSSRIRPIFYDCDFAFESKAASTLSRYFTGSGVASPDGSLTNMYIPTALKQSPIWCEKFLKRASEILNDYDIGKISLELYDRMTEEVRPEMKRNTQRWSWSYSEWESNIKARREVIASRPMTLVKQIKSTFNVSDEKMRELFPKYYA